MAAWRNVVDFEKADAQKLNDRAAVYSRVAFTYRCALACFHHYPEFWYGAAMARYCRVYEHGWLRFTYVSIGLDVRFLSWGCFQQVRGGGGGGGAPISTRFMEAPWLANGRHGASITQRFGSLFVGGVRSRGR
jgi:hypothetical protein